MACGPISAAVIEHLTPPRRAADTVEAPVSDSDPYGLDLHLALAVCYELHYRGFADVDDSWEWDPGVRAFRRRLEGAFIEAVRNDVGEIGTDATAADEMAGLSVEPID